MTQAEHRRDRLNEYRRAAGLPPVGPYGWPAFPDADDQARSLGQIESRVIRSLERQNWPLAVLPTVMPKDAA